MNLRKVNTVYKTDDQINMFRETIYVCELPPVDRILIFHGERFKVVQVEDNLNADEALVIVTKI